ncbi:LCP family protein [Alkalihalophilus pseudofirmus]|uniref:LCP family protein n=1 Tax=Alkalihalophilus pseudofirmus TaxID=79885 RepID=A0AAJ2NPQ1_ALKPS|nr:LCP family protein [Alkalihalophilus pseudofirmus]MDV2886310.1 LCP family protein [Alkalihalophilus pseudofirmus]
MAQSRLKRRKSRIRRTLKVFTMIGLLSFLIAGGAITYFVFQFANATSVAQQELERGEKSERRTEAVNPTKDNISILFLGVDDRDGNLDGRTDAMLLATFNRSESSIKILSIPRDSLVNIPGRANPDKINHAHAFGGLDLAVETVEELLDIPIDYYLKLNFKAFIEIIDALGGVEVDVPFTFSEQDSFGQHGAITLNEGTQLLNGEEALAYTRMRKNDPRGDIGRGERQQDVIQALIKKAATFSSISSYDDVFNSIGNHMTTNLSFGNMVALHNYAGSIDNMENLNFEGTDTRQNGVYYYQLDEASKQTISRIMRIHLGLEEAAVSTTPTN